MAFKMKTNLKSEIPTASMPDIIFMLLVFFMVTTVLREYDGLPIALPSATKIEKLESKRHTTHVWVNKSGLVSVDDKRVPINAIRNVNSDLFSILKMFFYFYCLIPNRKNNVGYIMLLKIMYGMFYDGNAFNG